MVSVIIPNYNHARYLDARIQSILNQSYRDFEIIILDDCSTDNSKDVIEKYRDNEFVTHIVYNEHNSGSTFKQWENGFELAKGELVWIAESDDCCDNRFLENLVPKFDNGKVVLAFSRSMQIDDERELGMYPTQRKINVSFDMGGKKFIKEYLAKSNIIVNASSAILRKDAIKNISKNYYTYKGCGDWLFWIYIAEQGDVCYEAKCLNYFRQHLSNTTSKIYKSGHSPKEVHHIYQYLSQKDYLKGLWKLWFRVSRLASYIQVDQFENRDVQQSVLQEWNFSFIDYVSTWLLRAYRWLK